MHSSFRRDPPLVVSVASDRDAELLSFCVFWQRRVYSVRATRTEIRAANLKTLCTLTSCPFNVGLEASRSNF